MLTRHQGVSAAVHPALGPCPADARPPRCLRPIPTLSACAQGLPGGGRGRGRGTQRATRQDRGAAENHSPRVRKLRERIVWKTKSRLPAACRCGFARSGPLAAPHTCVAAPLPRRPRSVPVLPRWAWLRVPAVGGGRCAPGGLAHLRSARRPTWPYLLLAPCLWAREVPECPLSVFLSEQSFLGLIFIIFTVPPSCDGSVLYYCFVSFVTLLRFSLFSLFFKF